MGNSEETTTKRLEETKADLEAVFESSHDGLVVADRDGTMIRVNSSYEKITGVPREEVVGVKAAELIARGIISESATLKVLQDGLDVTFSQVFRTGRHSIVTGSPIFGDNGEIVRVVTNIRDMTEIYRLKEELIETKKQVDQYSQVVETLTEEQLFNESLIFKSDEMEKVKIAAIKFAKVDAPILITGESGVGKEVIADLIYKNSLRKNAPFLKLNCGAIPEALLESELFGYEGGAFSGASKEGKVGLFELANHGTILLDEVGELPLSLQVKLLRFVQQKEFYKIGGKKIIKIDVRLLTATNRDLEKMMVEKQFRSDLFYRLNVLKIHVPPLRERVEDIIVLTNYFLKKYNEQYNMDKKISEEIYHVFTLYNWPGNVRQLENLIERLVVICDKDEISLEYLPIEMRNTYVDFPSDVNDYKELTYAEARETFEKKLFQTAIKKYKTTRKVAEKLGIDHSTVVKKAAKYGIELSSRWR